MPRSQQKDVSIEVYMSTAQKKQLKELATLNQKSMSEFILDVVFNTSFNRPSPDDDAFRELTLVLQKCFKDIRSFQHQQQIMMYVMIQFSMFLASFSRSRDEIMDFYEEAYQGAIGKFGKEE